jgi:hypothetical protein
MLAQTHRLAELSRSGADGGNLARAQVELRRYLDQALLPYA